MGPTTAILPTSQRRLRRVEPREYDDKPLRNKGRKFVWLDGFLAFCAVGGITASTLTGVQFANSNYAGSDFKTLYASIWCFVHGLNAYGIPNLQAVFIANNVVQPDRWYGHAPVYPWTTLALGAPFTLLSMTAACYAMTILSGALLGVAIFALLRYAANRFDVGPVWRAAIAGLCAGTPLVAFGMDMANVSLMASALCFLAFVWRFSDSLRSRRGTRWIPAAALAIAFLLKPHLAIWVGLAMALLPERGGRAVAARALTLITGFSVLTSATMVATRTLLLQTHGYLAMLAEETSSGASMSAASHEVLPVVSQITSLESVVGFWINNVPLRLALTIAALGAFAWLLFRQTRVVSSERGALMAASAWCALGTMATYHRAHDAVLLLLLLAPWVIDHQRKWPVRWNAWIVAALFGAMCVSFDLGHVQRWIAMGPANDLVSFVLLRQAAIADLLLLAAVQLALRSENSRHAVRRGTAAQTDRVTAAA